MEPIRSPLTGSTNVHRLTTIITKDLVNSYKSQFDYDITPLIGTTTSIGLYQCNDSGYQFFYPYDISGDNAFYNHFGKFDWYYLPWKWEHEISLSWISNNHSVLEVGAAKGDFLKRVQNIRDVSCTGLELNHAAVTAAAANGQNVLAETVESHALKHAGQYDVVCSYQVLEHIADVKSVIKAMVECLKPGGALIISVPNNDSFISEIELPSKILNMPPHHMGRWNEKSLKFLEGVVPVTWESTWLEPLQPIHTDVYIHTRMTKLLRSQFLIRAFWKFRLHYLLRPIVKKCSKLITGHSILVVFRKYAQN
jgi:2-polyprenyl-3-methyl-5-hydroxy-6-metoxy-1,4-benzoquinol methylase